MSKQISNVWIVAGGLVVLALVLLGLSAPARGPSTPATAQPTAPALPDQQTAPTAPATQATPQPANASEGKMTTTASGLQYEDKVAGTGAQPKTGQTVVVNYAGYLDNGTKFDSSYDRNQTFEFVLGTGAVIRGWDEGLATMKVGGKRRLVIPPQLAYGATGAGNGVIPPNATKSWASSRWCATMWFL